MMLTYGFGPATNIIGTQSMQKQSQVFLHSEQFATAKLPNLPA